MNRLIELSDLFNVVHGINLALVDLTQRESMDSGTVLYVSRSERNNGVSAIVEIESGIQPNPAHTLSVASSGSVLSSFYQPLPYYSGNDLYVLTPKKKMSIIEMLFYAKCINANKYKYNYGRQANKTLASIFVPAKMPRGLNNTLTDYYKKLLIQISVKPLSTKCFNIKINKWQDFKLIDLFEIKGSQTTPLLELEKYGVGKYPYVTTQATNNGVRGFYNYYTEKGNVITVDSAVIGYCAYQELPFSASDHVEKLIPKFKINKFAAMFLVTVINMEQYRYNYGIKCSQTRMKGMSIKLPAKNNVPDFEYMEDYIKSLPYSSAI